MARWNLKCTSCNEMQENVTCSIYAVPNCSCGGTQTISYDRGFRKSALFPFTVDHVDGKPMVIESMNHLRTVERDYGVVFSAFSKNNINDMDPADRELPQFRGEDPYVRDKYRERYKR